MKLSSLPAAISFEIQPDLYEPGADWTDASQYPEIKALDAFSSKDYQRLAWEVLRRMPLYRLHWKELKALGIPDTSNQEVKTSVIPTTQSSESKVNEIHLPDTDLMAAALADRTFVKELLQFWLQAYCAQLGGAMFSAQAFLAAAHTHIAELHPDSDFELDANAYEQVKAWAFEALANGRLTQGYADDDNRVTLAMSAKQV